MAMNSIQLQPGMSPAELFEQYGTKRCEQAREQTRWPEGFHCPQCGAPQHNRCYVEAEYQYRFNRRFDLKTILPRPLRAATTTGPRTDDWFCLAEHSC